MSADSSVVGVPASGNPDYAFGGAQPVFHDSRNAFEGAKMAHEVMYETRVGPREIDVEVSLAERIAANQEFETARLAKLAELGINVSVTKPFEYADARPEMTSGDVLLDFEDDVVDDNGDIVEDVDMLAHPNAVPVPKRGRPRK